jgi:3-methyladenine DNA glycosylase/8-oxoguanine DNA glycosylase
MSAPDVSTSITPKAPLNMVATLAPLGRGGLDPTMRITGRVVVRAHHTPLGPASTRFEQRGDGTVAVDAWGPGAAWAVEQAPELLGGNDSLEEFRPEGPIAALLEQHPGLRLCRSRGVFDALTRSILEQKVPGKEALLSYRAMVRAWSGVAPGPEGLMLPPTAQQVAPQPYHAFHPFNVEMKRANTLRGVASRAVKLEALVDGPVEDARRKLQSLDGIGPWTTAEVMVVAMGDADAVSVGDYHLPHLVSLAFTGEEKGDDARMLELLAPFVPHRARVVRLLWASGVRVQKKGPRRALRDFRSW